MGALGSVRGLFGACTDQFRNKIFGAKNLNLQIQSGSSIGIIGSTGVGKSTLVDIILGLLKPVKGKVLVDGKDISVNNNCLNWQNQIGYIPQEPELDEAKTVKTR